MNKISVCIATYNGEKYIKEQLESILHQLGPDDEVIISDDRSTDKTIETILSFNDSRIKIFENTIENRGLTYNFENAISKSNGDIIFLSDQDDVWLENKVKYCLEKLKENDLVVTNCYLVNNDLSIFNDSYFKLNNSKKGFLKNFYRSSYLGSCLAFKKSLLADILPFPKNLKLYHDWWIGIIADLKYKVYFIEEPLMYYRRHDNTMSTTGFKSQQKITKRILDRFQLLGFMIKRLYI